MNRLAKRYGAAQTRRAPYEIRETVTGIVLDTTHSRRLAFKMAERLATERKPFGSGSYMPHGYVSLYVSGEYLASYDGHKRQWYTQGAP